MARQSATASAPTRTATRGMAKGIIFMTLFGAAWAAAGVNALNGLGEPWLISAAAVVAVVLLGLGIRLLRQARNAGGWAQSESAESGGNRKFRFRLIFGIEIAAIMIAVIACRGTHRFDLIAPVIMLIVGIHFFPLAVLFGLRVYHLLGALLCLLTLGTVMLVPDHVRSGAGALNPWMAIIGIGGAAFLWAAGFANFARAVRLVKTSRV